MSLISVIAAGILSLAAIFPVSSVSEGSAQAFVSENGVSAKACVVIDALSGDVLYAKNEKQRLPMASTTKIMSALLVLKGEGLDDPFTVDSSAVGTEGSSMGLSEGDTVTLRTLAYGMLLPSGNDAANAAAMRIAGSIEGFADMMNDCAAELGLEDTHFVTPSGLDDDTDEHYSSAMDMAKLTRAALQDPDFREICGKKNAQVDFGDPPAKHWLKNTNKLLSSCEGVFGVKTGFTDKAGRCLVSACSRNGSELICVTLNDRNDWADHSALYDSCFKLIRDIELTPELTGYKIAAVRGEDVICEAECGKIRLPASAAARLKRVTLIKPFLYLPVSSGETVGTTRYYLDGRLVARLSIKAA